MIAAAVFSRRWHRSLGVICAAVICALIAAPSFAQEAHQHATAPRSWEWSVEGRVFFGYNYQKREFTDFDELESQNWVMTALSKTFASGSRLHFVGMFSAEPWTLRAIGSPQVFQTGETFEGAPLVDYQHPHDLFMNLGGSFTQPIGATSVSVSAYAVGPAPIGPPAFMHRASAADNPQSPLSHHYLDATHVTPGVVSISVERSGFGLEVGALQGLEPDEDRLDLDTAALDSFSARLSWANGPWQFQVSAADLKTPERKSPYDAQRVTASASYVKGDERRSIAWLAAFGQNRETFGNLEAYLFEAARRSGHNSFYTRLESVAKDILDAGFHPIGSAHTHRQSQVGALTLGYLRTLASRSFGSIGVGGDFTGYVVPDNLRESYGSPLSFHLFLRLGGSAGARMTHQH
ncbi:MAG: hypothetical protein ACKOEC_20095 [Acidimicrobiia bacterium]